MDRLYGFLELLFFSVMLGLIVYSFKFVIVGFNFSPFVFPVVLTIVAEIIVEYVILVDIKEWLFHG